MPGAPLERVPWIPGNLSISEKLEECKIFWKPSLNFYNSCKMKIQEHVNWIF